MCMHGYYTSPVRVCAQMIVFYFFSPRVVRSLPYGRQVCLGLYQGSPDAPHMLAPGTCQHDTAQSNG